MPNKSFLERVVDTRRNVEGVRSPTDHLRRLVKDVVALRDDGVSWQWIAEQFNAGRGPEYVLPVTTIRTLWTRVHKKTGTEEKTHPNVQELGESADEQNNGEADWLNNLFERETRRERRHGQK